MGKTDIICARCKKPARIQAENGVLCLECWRAVRKENRAKKQQESLNRCFSYRSIEKVTPKEAEIINEIMCELETSSNENIKSKKDI